MTSRSTNLKRKVVFSLLMGGISTGLISLILIYLNVGLSPKFIFIWLRSWGMAYLVVVPVILLLAPSVERMVNRWF